MFLPHSILFSTKCYLRSAKRDSQLLENCLAFLNEDGGRVCCGNCCCRGLAAADEGRFCAAAAAVLRR